MVNSMPSRSSPEGYPDALALIRDAALHATDLTVVVIEENASGRTIAWVNDAFTTTTGYPLAEVRGRAPELMYGPDTDRGELDRLRDEVREGRSATGTLLTYRRDGTSFWSQVSVTPVPDRDGAVRHWVAFRTDVTTHVEAAAAERASLEAERRARSDLSLVRRVSDLLLDRDDPYVLRKITGLLVDDVVAWAGFFIDADGLHPVGSMEAALRGRPAPAHRRATATEGADPVRDVLTGVLDGPLRIEVDEPAAGPMTSWLVEHLEPALARLPGTPRSLVVFPVPGRRRPAALLVTVPREAVPGAGMGVSDQSVVQLVVRRVGSEVENQRLYVREHELAETLQRAMLPEQADVRGLDVWTYYAPSSGHAQVGGDWYDVLEVSPGVVALVIGDVVGHDVEAAAAMGQLRSVVRAYVHETIRPGQVLDRVDHLVAGMPLPRSASLVLAVMSRTASGWTVEYSRAGHLPPVAGRGGEVVPLDDAGGPMIGYGARERDEARHELAPGDLLVLYTDGLIERRDRTLRTGLGALVEATAQVEATDAAGVGEDLLARLADDPEDDIALVVVRVPDPGLDAAGASSPRRRRWSLPSEPGSIARARQAVRRTSTAWGIEEVPAAELVVSELVANAVLHGWGHVVLRLFDTGAGLRIEVEDSNPAPPVTADGHPGRVGGYGMQIIERLAEWGWRPAGAGKLVWARMRPGAARGGPFGGSGAGGAAPR